MQLPAQEHLSTDPTIGPPDVLYNYDFVITLECNGQYLKRDEEFGLSLCF